MNWVTGDGHIAPLLVPTTQGAKLVKILRKVVDAEEKDGVKLRIL